VKLVVAVRTAPVPTDFTVTVAPAIAALCGLRTLPPIWPASVCAVASQESETTASSSMARLLAFKRRVMRNMRPSW